MRTRYTESSFFLKMFSFSFEIRRLMLSSCSSEPPSSKSRGPGFSSDRMPRSMILRFENLRRKVFLPVQCTLIPG